jgi:hypothetical protein
MTRILVALMGLTLLSACNVPITEKPMFTAADEAGAPPMKPGVWLIFNQPGCQVDVNKPIDTWDDCAGGAVVSPGDLKGFDAKKGAWEHAAFVLASGDPRVGQVQLDVDTGVSADANGQQQSGSHQKSKPYGYAAVRPGKLDPKGQIVTADYWFVYCGPPPPKDKNGADTAMGTMKPLPGMKMKPGDAVCVPASKDALRAAAKASEHWGEAGVSNARWLRDGDR